jgi:flagellar basal body-associated protein FliL
MISAFSGAGKVFRISVASDLLVIPMSAVRILTLVVMVLLLATLFSSGSAQARNINTDETRTIQNNGFSIIMLYQAQQSSSVSYSFNVVSGSNVDVLVLNQANFNAYIIQSTFSYLPGTILDSSSGSASASTPNDGGIYYVVIDNTNAPNGGATPTGAVEVHFSVTATNVNDIPSIISRAVLIILIGGILFVAVILILLYFVFLRKPKAQTPPPSQTGGKICPNCGSNMPYDFQYCPKCGRKW